MNDITKIAKMVAEIVIEEMAEAHTTTKIEQTTKPVLHEIGQNGIPPI
jgi:hypothetical protein